MATRKLCVAVQECFKRCLAGVREAANDRFHMAVEDTLRAIESPIEQCLYLAMETVLFSNPFSTPIHIQPQWSVGAYRIDFRVYAERPEGKPPYEVAVECDSQQWHERSEQERRAEKERDRFIQQEGMKVFRYTGKELLDNPLPAAKEIIGFVTDEAPEYLWPYNIELPPAGPPRSEGETG